MSIADQVVVGLSALAVLSRHPYLFGYTHLIAISPFRYSYQTLLHSTRDPNFEPNPNPQTLSVEIPYQPGRPDQLTSLVNHWFAARQTLDPFSGH